ncbi:hypothetical protein PInf_025770 [Phytophthora infestans]|nr:hypothetical protein PInf_025770 [Phytophthora infestans]
MTRSDASRLDESPAGIQELEPGCDVGDADSLLLHLLRIILLYLFMFLSQTADVVTDAELADFFSNAATSDLVDEQTTELQRRLHAALLEWVPSEVKNDGLLQEQKAFVVIKRLFRQQRTKSAVQCRVLAALLTSYLTQLETPLVHCEASSMLSSTLEYLLTKERDAASQESIPLSMLYPLVNAVDLVSIEQRECLDALMNVFRWFSMHDQSQKVFTTFTTKYHRKIIGLSDNKDELGICFVQMLQRYSDHIFRRDLQFEDLIPTVLYSDTEDDDASSEDGTRLAVLSDSDLSVEKEKAVLSTRSSHTRKERREDTIKTPCRPTAFDADRLFIGVEWQDEVCFGVAAAGTLAAVLCVFFT